MASKSVRRAIAFSTIASFGNLAISLALVIIVSRLVSPAVVGGFVMAYAVILLIDPLREMQLQSWVIRKADFGPQDFRPVRFVALVTSAVAMVISVAGAMIFYGTYETPTVGNCLLIMSFGFVFNAITQPLLTLLQREMQYGQLAKVKLGAGFAKSFVTIGLVLAGYGAEGMAWGIVAEAAFALIAYRFAEPRFRRILPGTKGSKEIFVFCSQFAGAQQMNQIAAALAPLVIGAYQGLTVAAFYNRATTLTRVVRSGIEQAILPIALSSFAKDSHDPELLKKTYLHAIATLTGITWPALVGFAALSAPLVCGSACKRNPASGVIGVQKGTTIPMV